MVRSRASAEFASVCRVVWKPKPIEGGPNVWWTDSFGRNGRTEPFPGAIRQWVASRDNDGLDLHGPTIGKNRNYDALGVRAPN